MEETKENKIENVPLQFSFSQNGHGTPSSGGFNFASGSSTFGNGFKFGYPFNLSVFLKTFYYNYKLPTYNK